MKLLIGVKNVAQRRVHNMQPIKIAKRHKIHLLITHETLCGIDAVTEGIVVTFDWDFDATRNAICKQCYTSGIEKLQETLEAKK